MDATKTPTIPPTLFIYYPTILVPVLSFLSALDASLLLGVLGLTFDPDWRETVKMFTSPLRDIPEVAAWIATMIENGHAAFLIGGDLNRWRYPLTTYDKSRSTLRLWLAVRVRRGVDKELAWRRKQQQPGDLSPFFAVTDSGRVVWARFRQTWELGRSNGVLTHSSLIPIPGSERPGPSYCDFLDRTQWLETKTNENGVQLVYASTRGAGSVPIIELCPTQWQDQSHENEGLDGWHRSKLACVRCDRSAPGAVVEGTRYGCSVFRLPYLNLSTMEYSNSGMDNVDASGLLVEPDDLALAVRFDCGPGPGPKNVWGKIQGIPWVAKDMPPS
ncbi:hypothetical protein VTK56DRAFT_4230 [Thermocarpiscus australiensis]